MSAGAPYVPALSGQSHGAKKPHFTFIGAVRPPHHSPARNLPR